MKVMMPLLLTCMGGVGNRCGVGGEEKMHET